MMYLWDRRLYPKTGQFYHETKSINLGGTNNFNTNDKIDTWNRLIPYYIQGNIEELLKKSERQIHNFFIKRFPYKVTIPCCINVTKNSPSECRENFNRANLYFARIAEQVEANFFLCEWDYDKDAIFVYLQSKFDGFTASLLG